MIGLLLQHLKGFDEEHDLETHHAFYKTRLSWIAPVTFLNIVYKPESSAIVGEAANHFNFPPSLRQFYEGCNGARLFFDNLRIYGCVREGTILDRANPLTLPPIAISRVNSEFRNDLEELNAICVGSYGYDRSLVCVHREEESVTCFCGTDFLRWRRKWPTLDEWLVQEIDRLSSLFTPNGRLSVHEKALLPPEEGAQYHYRI